MSYPAFAEWFHITAEVLRNIFIGRDEQEFGLIELRKRYQENIKKLAGKSLDQSTINKFGQTFKHVGEFIKRKYKLSELLVRQLNMHVLRTSNII